MPIKNSGSEREPIDMMELGRRIAARKAALGVPDPPRNAGKNRGRSRSSTRSPRAGRCGQRGAGRGQPPDRHGHCEHWDHSPGRPLEKGCPSGQLRPPCRESGRSERVRMNARAMP